MDYGRIKVFPVGALPTIDTLDIGELFLKGEFPTFQLWICTGSGVAMISDNVVNAEWGAITGDINNQADLITKFSDYVLNTDLATILADYVTDTELATTLADYITNAQLTTILSSYVTDTDLNTALNSYVPNARQITINGVTQSLATNRTWSVGEVPNARTLTINGVTYNLGADRVWSVGEVPNARTITIDGVTQDLSANRSWTTSGGGGATILSASENIIEGSWSGNTDYQYNVSVTGAVVGDFCLVMPDEDVMANINTAGTEWNGYAYCTSANTVTVICRVTSFINIPASSIFKVKVIQ